MPDPQVLYIVTAVVVLALVAWVVVVLGRPETPLEAAGKPARGSAAGTDAEAAAADSKDDRPKLNSHTEIRDEPGSAPSVSQAVEMQVDVEEEEEPTGPNALILVTAVGLTDPGLKRKHNEDAYATLEDHHLFVIADGMGRHAAGEIASQLCVDAITEAFNTGAFGPAMEPSLPRRASRLRGSIQLAN